MIKRKSIKSIFNVTIYNFRLFNAGDMNKWDISSECNVNTAGL